MPDPLNLVHHAVGQQPPQILYGQVSSLKPAPSSFSSPLYVVLPQWQPDNYWKFTTWPACHGSTLPAQGATVMLAADDQRNLHVVKWDAPSSAFAPTGAAGGVLAGSYPNPSLAVDRLQIPSGTMSAPARSLGTAYQPSATRPTFVLVTFTLPSSGANCSVTVRMDAANPPTTAIALAQNSNAAATLVQVQVPVSFLVPAASYYQFVLGAGSPTITSTFEYAL